MLSNENRNAPTPEGILAAFAEANRAAKQLATSLIRSERNENPMREREAPHPAHSTVIRIIRPMPPNEQLGFDVEGARLHNTYVETLGRAGIKFK